MGRGGKGGWGFGFGGGGGERGEGPRKEGGPRYAIGIDKRRCMEAPSAPHIAVCGGAGASL